jgi:putative transposase
MVGGAMRTRTKNPDRFIDGARRDRCAIVAEAVRDWGAVDTNTAYIERGSPWANGYIESFNARLRDELLDGEIFYSLREAQTVIESWRRHYNRIRPHAPEVFVPGLAA